VRDLIVPFLIYVLIATFAVGGLIGIAYLCMVFNNPLPMLLLPLLIGLAFFGGIALIDWLDA